MNTIVGETYASRIHDALMDPAPRSSVAGVKSVVLDEFRAFDPAADVRATDYFNHTFAPDFVMKWTDKTERYVFLRPTYDMQGVSEDLHLIHSKRPMIFGLTKPVEPSAALDEALEAAEGFFTEPEAVEQLIDTKSSVPTSRIVSNALAQGGRGALIGSAAAKLNREVAAGFVAAGELRVEPTFVAMNAVTRAFDQKRASRLSRVLQAVWEGNDGRLDQFPGPVDVSGRLAQSELQYLLDFLDTDDDVFWKRIGRSVTLNELAKLVIGSRGQSFNRLVRANLDVITAGAMALFVEDDPLVTKPDEGTFRWDLANGKVRYSGPRFYAVVAELKDEVAKLAQGAGCGASPRKVVERSPELNLSQVTMQARGDSIAYSSAEGPLDRQRLLGIAEQLRPDVPLAVSAIAHSATGKVNVDFAKDLAWRTTSSKLLMADLLGTAVPLLHDFDELERADLKRSLAYDNESLLVGFDALGSPSEDSQPTNSSRFV